MEASELRSREDFVAELDEELLEDEEVADDDEDGDEGEDDDF